MKILNQKNRRMGATAVEMAVISMVFFSLFLGVLEFGRYFFIGHVSLNATREAARYASAHTGDGTSTQTIIDMVNSQMAGQNAMLQNYLVEVLNVNPGNGQVISNTNWNDAQFGGAIMVRVTGTYRFTMPILFFLPSFITLNASSIVNSEGT
ncbi:MAG: TadE family protein [Planctomycetia bacterium]|jgi:Flp pilus assembly protein TadG